MLTRGNPCLRRRALSAILDNVATTGPEEPLLFLYPRWATTRRSIASVNTTTATTRRSRVSGRFLSSRDSGPLSLGRCSSARWMSSRTAVGEQEGQRQTESVSEDAGSEGNEEGAEKRQRLNVFADIESDGPLNIFPVPPSDKRRRIAVTSRTHSRPLTISPKKRLGVLKGLSFTDWKKLRYRAHLKHNAQSKTQPHRWDQWTQVKDLIEHMQEDTIVWPRKGIKQKMMLIPEETVALLAGVSDLAMMENIWYVSVLNGCRVHVLRPRDSEGYYRKAILSGSARAVELVSTRIAHAQHLQQTGDPLVDVRKPAFPIYPSVEASRQKGMPVPRVRAVWDFYVRKQRPLPIEELESFEEPTSVREFLEYVEDLTGSTMATPYRREGENRQLSHQERVAQMLLELFRKDKNWKFISTAALNRALDFLNAPQFAAHRRRLLSRCEHLATVDTFNILLRSCGKQQDIGSFRYFLRYMSRLQIRPDSYTWVALLDGLLSTEARANLFMYMMQKGYLTQPGPMRSALQSTVQDTFLEHLRAGGDVDSFINLIQKTYGANWFSSSMVNQMFSVTVTLKNYDAMNRLLQICEQHGINISSWTLLQILPMFRADIFSALLYVFRYIDRPVFHLTKQICERLFLIAFKGRHYNICRVLWRYACMNGTTTYKMKMSVLSTLTTNVPKARGRDKRDIYDKIWRSNAGKVIVGVDLHRLRVPPEDIAPFTPAEYRDNPVLSLTTGFTEGDERERQLQLASALVNRDITHGRRYGPIIPFATMLDAAALVDLEWKNTPRPPNWMLQNAVQVPVKWRGYLKSSMDRSAV